MTNFKVSFVYWHCGVHNDFLIYTDLLSCHFCLITTVSLNIRAVVPVETYLIKIIHMDQPMH